MLHLGSYISARNIGELLLDTGFILSRNPDTVRVPDVPFVRKARELDDRGFFPGAPDIAIEVVSPSDRLTEVRRKVGDYLRAGTLLVIVIDPDTQIAWTYTQSGQRELTINDSLEGLDVVPGWTLPLRELFS